MKFKKAGFTLAEAMVATFVSLIILVGLVGLWLSSVQHGVATRTETLAKNQISSIKRQMQQDINEATLAYVSTSNTRLILGKNLAGPSTAARRLISSQPTVVVSYCIDGVNLRRRLTSVSPGAGTINLSTQEATISCAATSHTDSIIFSNQLNSAATRRFVINNTRGVVTATLPVVFNFGGSERRFEEDAGGEFSLNIPR